MAITETTGLGQLNFKGDVRHSNIIIPSLENSIKKENSPLVLVRQLAINGGSYANKLAKDENFDARPTVKLPGITTKDPIVSWTEFALRRPLSFVTTSGINNSTDTTFTMADASVLRVDQVLFFPVGKEWVKVTAVNTGTNTVTIARNLGVTQNTPRTLVPGGVTAKSKQTHASGATFLPLATGVVHGSTFGDTRKYQGIEERVTATQNIRSNMSINNVRYIQQQKDRSKHTQWQSRQEQEVYYMAEELEATLLFGATHYDSLARVGATTGALSTGAEDAAFTLSDGLFNAIETYASGNVITATSLGGPVLSYDVISEYIRTIDAAIGTSENTLHMCGYNTFRSIGRIDSTLNNIKYDLKFDKGMEEQRRGTKIRTIDTQFGSATFFIHPMFDTAGTTYANRILTIQKDRLNIAALEGMEFKWSKDSGDHDYNGYSGIKKYCEANLGLLLAYADEHFILDGITQL